ncbi:MAG: NADP-dependent malic enzyme [Alphaproteobacteria bacterium]|jgi:malate dehydrogenase (oxaloacetate-decarboxylating)(NADP+)|nr:NADP-dependent malic enzyme [Rhodospirillaceae bacterium]MDG2482755.1 NADP-dependent malic enzyme [Alphaproteobacteria bacterium]
MSDEVKVSDAEALRFHAEGRPGKLAIAPTKPLDTARDLSLAYSPGVAAPCLEIFRDPNLVFDYTSRGNLVAIVSNGTAVLGLGNLGALGAKPVMEGKAVLFKRFADVDGIDIEIDSEDVDEIVNTVRLISPTFGGVNLEDIKAPECFIIEQRLRELVDIPVFHDDQHGTAIICLAGVINALEIAGKKIQDCKVVVNGAGAAGIACLELIKARGLPHDNAILCDSKGVVYQGREAGMNQWKSAHAVDTPARTLDDAMQDCDIFLGVSVKGAVTREMVATMADNPIIFAMANPDPEITPEEVRAVRDDAITATGRSDYPNQVNNVLGFPYIFRGALDVRATTINDPMKIAAAEAIAALAREDVPDEVASAYTSGFLRFGAEYIIPKPFDPRLISRVPPAVAKSAMDSGVARRPIIDMEGYCAQLSGRLSPVAGRMYEVFENARSVQARVVFAEGEEEKTIRAAALWRDQGLGTAILVGREDRILERMESLGVSAAGLEIANAKEVGDRDRYVQAVYSRMQRKGALLRDCQRWINLDRNVFAAAMLAAGDADAMVTGLTRSYAGAVNNVRRVLDAKPGEIVCGMSILVSGHQMLFVADSTINEDPTAEQLADITVQAAAKVRSFGLEPRVALMSFSNFGSRGAAQTANLRGALEILNARGVDFEVDGEMSPDTALDAEALAYFPFAGISGPANVLIMPNLHTANISYKLVEAMDGAHVIGPILLGLEKPVQIVRLGATVNDLLNMAALAAVDVRP